MNNLFDGITYEPKLDRSRLKTQLSRVRNLMSDSCWRTLTAIATDAGGSEAGVSARLRDLRKAKHGGFRIEKRRVLGGGGLFLYRMLP